MQPARYIPRYTYSDYLLWEGNWEMIDGIPCAMSPSPTRRHQLFSYILTNEIVTGMRSGSEPCRDYATLQDVDWIVDDHTVLRPDIAVVCDQTGDFITSPPSVIIEILSPSTA